MRGAIGLRPETASAALLCAMIWPLSQVTPYGR